MFLKPFRIKSIHQLNKTERREFKDFCNKSFPLSSDSNIYEDCISKKDKLMICKLLTYCGQFVNAYLVNRVPLFFDYNEQLFPTVYFLWTHPDSLLYFTTHTHVIKKLQNGADLMLPGLCPEISSSLRIATFERGTKLLVNTSNNKAAVAVGVTAESASVLRSSKAGKCAIIYHCFDDHLCKINNMPVLPVPQLGPSHLPFPSLKMLQPLLDEPNATADQTPTPQSQETVKKAMDDLLLRCLLVAMKFAKDMKIPMLVSTFCNTYIKEACPAVNIKKSSYGRITTFLLKCAKDGLIAITKKGHIYIITKFHYDHQLVKEFKYDSEQEPKISIPTQEKPKLMTIKDVYFITQPVLPLFQKIGIRPGTAMSVSEIDAAIKDYLKTHNLALQGNDLDFSTINMADFLKSLLPKEETLITYLDLKNLILDRMTKGHTLKIGDVETTKKGELVPIIITTAFRSNKCVTMVNNAEQYNINLLTLSKECQIGKATGAKVNPGVRPSVGNELQLQGNQIIFLKNLLISKYGVPENCIVVSQKKK